LEEVAVRFVSTHYGFAAQQGDFSGPLPFDDATFSFVLSRFAIHYLRPCEARDCFKEVLRVLKPGGSFLFAVNSETHRRLGLQYNYSGAIELEPQVWRLPSDMDRTILFYTPELARMIAGPGWQWRYLADEAFQHWNGIDKRAVIGLAQKL
jgi:ubiquinone/menaquinone biosynthesis C-methylase UbiE